jgi:hypothetical protein
MVKRLKLETRSVSKVVSSAPPPRGRIFDYPNILTGEDAAAYEELRARVRAAIKPVDIVEDMFVADVVSLQWEVVRWRRLKLTLLQAAGLKTLQNFLVEQLQANYALHEEYFASYLAKILRNSLPQEQADSAETLAAECAPSTGEADAKLDEVLRSIGLNSFMVLRDSYAQKAKELVQEYMRREPNAVTLIDELLTEAGESMHSFMADGLAERLDYIERFDRLTMNAEERRNAMLGEIERRRAVFGATLRRNVQEIEDAEFEEIGQRKNEP